MAAGNWFGCFNKISVQLSPYGQNDIAPITNWYSNNIHLMMVRYWLDIGLLTRGRNCGMLERSSLVRPLGIIILASLQKDFDSLLTTNWTLLTAKRLAGHHIVPYFVHVPTQALGGGFPWKACNDIVSFWCYRSDIRTKLKASVCSHYPNHRFDGCHLGLK